MKNYHIETLGMDLVYSDTKYISDIFNNEDMFIDVANSEYISVNHHTYKSFSLSLCRRIAKHIRKQLNYKQIIFVGGYSFLV
jgi:hypothetical protein